MSAATPQPGLHRASLPANKRTASFAPFPCKRRAAWSSFDSQEWLRAPSPVLLHRLQCEYTDKQPSHDEAPGATENPVSASDVDASSADQEENSSFTGGDRGDAHLQGGSAPSIGLDEQLTDGQPHQLGGEANAQHPERDAVHMVEPHQESTSDSIQLGGEESERIESVMYEADARSVALGSDDEGDPSLPGHSGNSEDAGATAEQEGGPEGIESVSNSEAVPKDRPEDRGQELQGTKIAAAPDLMASRPAMLSAPAMSVDGEEIADSDDEEPVASVADGEGGVSTIAADLPILPGALLSPEDLEATSSEADDEPDGRSLHVLLPLKAKDRKKSGRVNVTATRTPDGTMFSFKPTKPSSPASKQVPPAPPADATSAAITPGTAPAPNLPKMDGIPSTDAVVPGILRGIELERSETTRHYSGSVSSTTQSDASGQVTPTPGAVHSSETAQQGGATARPPPVGPLLEPTATGMVFDEAELSDEEEYLLIQMEAAEAVQDTVPADTSAQLQVDSSAPTIASEGTEPDGFFKDVDVRPPDGSAPQPDRASRAAPQTVRPVENATDTSSAPPKASGSFSGTGASERHSAKKQRGTGGERSSKVSNLADSGPFSVMMRGAGSVRQGPVSQSAGKGTGLQVPKVAMPADADPDSARSTPEATTSSIAGHADSSSATADPSTSVSAVNAIEGTATLGQQTAQQAAASMQSASIPIPASNMGTTPTEAVPGLPSVIAGAGLSEKSTGTSDLLPSLSPQSPSQASQASSLKPPETSPSAAAFGPAQAETPSSAVADDPPDSGGLVHETPQPPQQLRELGKPSDQPTSSSPRSSISSHPLDGVPVSAADDITVALVRKQHGHAGNGNGNRTTAGMAGDGSDGAAVADSPQAGAGAVDTPPATTAPSGDAVSAGGTMPEMPSRVRHSSEAAARRDREPPTDAASAIAIAALAAAAAGIPSSGLVRGVRARRGRIGTNVDSTDRNANTAALSAPADAFDSSDAMTSIDPDDAGSGKYPALTSAATPAAAAPSGGRNGTKSSSQPEPLLSGPPLDDPPDTLIHPFHLTLFAVLLIGAIAFAITVINFTTDMGWLWSAVKVFRKLAKSLAFRQSIALMVAIAFVRYGLEPLVRSVRSVFSLPGPWERSTEYFILKQVYQPLEFLLFVAAISTVVEAVLPPLVAVQKETVRIVVRTMLSLTYVIASAFVVFNIKARIVQEKRWTAELSGDTAAQRSLEATNKLLTVLFLFVATLLGLQAIGLDIQSVLAISGFGGLALGLAGREILENVFNGLLIVSSRSFVVGEEIMFTQSGHAGRIIEGIIMDIGWYRTLIRSFEREVYIVPNSVFSRTVVLNVTRKGKEWRVFENIGVRVEDISAVPSIIGDMRLIIRNDVRVLPKLHRRVFLDKVNRNELTIYISFYIEAANRDAFMATKQEIFLEFALACERHGAQLASNRHQVQLVPNLQHSGAASLRLLADTTLDPEMDSGFGPEPVDDMEGEEGGDISTSTEEGSDEDPSTQYRYQDR